MLGLNYFENGFIQKVNIVANNIKAITFYRLIQ